MDDWNVKGQLVGSHHPASVLNELSDLKDIHTFADKTVPRFDAGVKVRGNDVSGFFSFACAIRATKKMKKKALRELLEDTSLLNTKNAPSLIYVEVGSKVHASENYRCLHVFKIHYYVVLTLQRHNNSFV